MVRFPVNRDDLVADKNAGLGRRQARIDTGDKGLAENRARDKADTLILDTARKQSPHIALEAALVDIQHFVIVDRVGLDPARV